jgi:hypothetical protein
MTTKRFTKTCAVLRRKKPTQKQYIESRSDAGYTLDECAFKFGKQKKKATTRDGGGEVPLPHDWPPYGGECWQQAYEEMQSLQAMAAAWTAYTIALNSSYMPPLILEIYGRAYLEAKTWYVASWTAMEGCLNMIV